MIKHLQNHLFLEAKLESVIHPTLVESSVSKNIHLAFPSNLRSK